jgi:hypothetical protein
MPHRTPQRALMITLLCAVLFSMAPAPAHAIDTTRIAQPTSRTAVIEVPRDGEGREGRETQGISLPLCMGGVILGVFLGLLGSHVLRGWQGRQAKQRALDQLAAQFQALFRESDQRKKHES